MSFFYSLFFLLLFIGFSNHTYVENRRLLDGCRKSIRIRLKHMNNVVNKHVHIQNTCNKSKNMNILFFCLFFSGKNAFLLLGSVFNYFWQTWTTPLLCWQVHTASLTLLLALLHPSGRVKGYLYHSY